MKRGISATAESTISATDGSAAETARETTTIMSAATNHHQLRQNNLSFPMDVWLHLTEFLTWKELGFGLFLANKTLLRTLDHESLYEHRARRTYPKDTCRVDNDAYQGRWKNLVQDDNAYNGIYVRTIRKLSPWRLNGQMEDLLYFSMVRELIWDRQSKTISVVVEAYGHDDLRKACQTNIYSGTRPASGNTNNNSAAGMGTTRGMQNEPDNPADWLTELQATLIESGIPPTRPPPPGGIGFLLWKTCTKQHDLVRMEFDQRFFQSQQTSYHFIYNGIRDINRIPQNDYACVEFLSTVGVTTLKEVFDTSHRDDTTFQARPRHKASWKTASNILEWPISLPPHIREKHETGRWGNVQDFPDNDNGNIHGSQISIAQMDEGHQHLWLPRVFLP